MATVTSLPEPVVSVAASESGAIDMAAANLFGSNLFNAAVLGVDVEVDRSQLTPARRRAWPAG